MFHVLFKSGLRSLIKPRCLDPTLTQFKDTAQHNEYLFFTFYKKMLKFVADYVVSTYCFDFNGGFPPSVSVTTFVDIPIWKEHLDSNCNIHTKRHS